MKTMLVMAALALTSTIAVAQNEETRNVSDFNSIKVENGIEVIYTHNDTESVKVKTTDNNAMNYVVTERSGKELRIYINNNAKDAAVNVAKNIQVYVSDNNTASITAKTGATVKVTNQINTPKLSITLKTGSTFTGNINATEICDIKAASGSAFKGSIITEEFKAIITGGAYVALNGHAEKSEVLCNGGTLTGDKFTCEKAEVWAKRMSSVALHVTDSVMATTDTSSAISYSGKPNKIHLGDDNFAIRKN
ncbi:GIN domain-containing protein [Flavobacterium litorale]|uniref:DUF2807 domain-containing protein n=1 Tax=Flavobacterium litorale TaxID=2856519 RepID=A0ABX8V6C1_9FLAO|nr:DUF2807 domain-containing protein [Flavobacterium litorale]QYJ68384.1 DUF2807 domain-containing protein [Flavobacterium litorale]